jgi:hypothetical protein
MSLPDLYSAEEIYWKNTIKVDIKIGYGDVKMIHFAPDI